MKVSRSHFKKRICLFSERNIADLTGGLALITMIITSSKDWKVLLCTQGIPKHTAYRQYTFPIGFFILMSYRQLGVNVLHIVIAFKSFKLVCKVILVLIKWRISRRLELIISVSLNWLQCTSNFLMQKTQDFLFPNRNDDWFCQFGCSVINLHQWAKRLSQDFVNPIPSLGLGYGFCKHLLTLWKVSRKSSNWWTKELTSLLWMFKFSWSI